MIIINGASRGIGKYLFNRYLDAGVDVVGTYNSTSPDNHIERYFKVDVTDPGQIEEFFNKIENKLPELSLINCAGTNYNSFAHKSALVEWKRVIETNLIGTFSFIRVALGYMRQYNYGRIINFSSVVAQKGVPGTSAYAASKSGLWGLARSIAVENSELGITINNINLGYFDIGMISEVPAKFKEGIIKSIPNKKLGDPNEIFLACEYLRSSPYINGTSIDISAGLV